MRLTSLGPSFVSRLKPLSSETPHPDLDDLLDDLLDQEVALNKGGSLLFEPTSALITIDVNGGEARHALTVNLEAMQQVARYIRLCNLSGLFVIDCLKMSERTHKAKVIQALTRATAEDPAGVHVFDMTKLGLIEFTRTRRGPSLYDIRKGL
jgi:ribonuclease E/ribonuclease G